MHMTPPNFAIGRREFMTAAAATALGAIEPMMCHADPVRALQWHGQVISYLKPLERKDGGYAWDDLTPSHLTPTHAAIGCFRLLRNWPPNPEKLAQFVRTHHPSQLKKLEQEHRGFDLQQILSLRWLDEDISTFRETVLGWKSPLAYLKQYEQHGYPVFQYEVAPIIALKLLELPMSDLPAAFVHYVDERRRANGSFNNTPASDGSDGNVLNTWWGLWALHCLGRADENKEATIAWLQSCQYSSGSFTHQPHPEIGNVDDVLYTWAAVRALGLLGAKPKESVSCVNYLRAGFGSRPGWSADPLSLYYILDALTVLGAINDEYPRAPERRQPRDEQRSSAPKEQKPLMEPVRAAVAKTNGPQAIQYGVYVFSIQIESHGQGSPTEAVDLASSLRIHLWGAKNAKPEWLARAQAIADAKKVPVKFFVANEEYGTWINVPGMGTYSHMSDIIAPAGVDIGPSLANKGVVSWQEYRERRLKPLLAAGGRLIWQFGENEALVRMLLDDSIERGGFAAISTFHFGNPDFTNTEPFLNCYRGQLPFVALQDAHGPEPWWFADMTSGFRTLFLATEPTWNGWLNALKNNWVVSVRHDAVSGGETWMHGGNDDTIRFVRERASEWQWWDDVAPRRPPVSIVAVAPQDQFEVGRPESGITIRVRCAFENTTQGLAKKPLAELVKLTVDGAEAKPKLVERRRPNGNWDDHYHLYHIVQPTAGKHTATATVHDLATKRESQRTIEFVV
jgi:prenyltransferase beta subunit